jgi:hypothetical protein
MLSTALFEVLDLIARTAKRSNKPFGGLQLICVGNLIRSLRVIRQESFIYLQIKDEYAYIYIYIYIYIYMYKYSYTGDFMQLPPVIRREQTLDTDDQDPTEQRKFCFQSPIWKAAGLTRSEGGTLILGK